MQANFDKIPGFLGLFKEVLQEMIFQQKFPPFW